MELPPYYITRPEADWSAGVLAAFGDLFERSIESGSGGLVDYALPAPKWQFLCFMSDHRDVVLHGSGNPEITEFEPRKPNDATEFGNQRAIYAASDGLWAMYFAIVDRERYVRSLVNSCFRVIGPQGRSEPHYFFSINGDALPHDPWRNGTVYILPRENFEMQPAQRLAGAEIELAQWRSFVPVKPLAKLAVGPEDFPFLANVHPHDPATVRERALADPDGFPWLDESDA